jgi:hypothetical protein
MTQCEQRNKPSRRILWLACCTVGLLATGAARSGDGTQPSRDPMAPPAILLQPARSAASDAAPPAPVAPTHLLLINGQRYVVEGSRRYGVGAAFAGGRIERIDDSSVWLRDGAGLHALSLYGGVAKRAAAESITASDAAGNAAGVHNDRVHPNRSADHNPNR